MLMSDGTLIKNDVIESFDFAVEDPSNQKAGVINWDFVSADMHMDLSSIYNYNYIDECFDTLAEKYMFK